MTRRADNARTQRRDRAARLTADPTLAPHGNPSTYSNWECRCRPCTTAHVKRCAAYAKGWAA